MPVVAICIDAQNSASLRGVHFAAHVEHLKCTAEAVLAACVLDVTEGASGALGDGVWGSLLILDLPDVAAARRLVEGDPYWRERIWRTVDLYEPVSIQGVWGPDFEQARAAARIDHPEIEPMPPLPGAPLYAMLARFDAKFRPSASDLLGHKRAGAAMANRLMAAMPLRFAARLGSVGADAPWQLCYLLHARDLPSAREMNAIDPIARYGAMEARFFAIPISTGSWLAA